MIRRDTSMAKYDWPPKKAPLDTVWVVVWNSFYLYPDFCVFFFGGGHLESWRVDLPPVDLSALENSHYNRHITIAMKTTARKSSNTRRTRAKRDQPEKEREEKQTIVSEKSRCSCISNSVILFLIFILKTMIKVFAKCIHKGKTFNPSELIENWILFNSRRTIQKDSWWLKKRKTKTKKNMSQAAFSNFPFLLEDDYFLKWI